MYLLYCLKYLLISNLYADSANGCGDSQFNKRAVFWLAAQTARKAGRVDASLKKLISLPIFPLVKSYKYN